MIRQLLNIVTFFISFSSFGQEYIVNVQHFGTEHGLSHRYAHTAFQDSRGFVWIGTEYGLNRFDGHTFQIFTKEKNNLSSNTVNFIIEDQEGWLWIITSSNTHVHHISFIHVETLEVQTIEERFGTNWPLYNKVIYSTIGRARKNLFLSSPGVIYEYKEGEFHSIPLGHRDVIRFEHYFPDKNQLLVIKGEEMQNQELSLLDEKGQEKFLFILNFKPDLSQKLTVDHLNDIWILRDDTGWIKISSDSGEITKYGIESIAGISGNRIAGINKLFFNQADGEYSFWVSAFADKHLSVFSPELALIFDIGKVAPQIPQSEIEQICFDNQKNKWICTQLGVYKVQLTKSPFKNYLSLSKENYTIQSGFSSRGLTVYNNQLWANSVSTKQFLIDLKTNIVKPFPQSPFRLKLPVFRPLLKINEDLIYTASRAIYPYQNGTALNPIQWKKNSRAEMIWSLFQDARSQIWVGTLNVGLAMVKGDSIANFDKYNEFNQLEQSSIYHFLEWDDEHILIASTSGLYVLHQEKGIIQQFGEEALGTRSIPHNNIHHIYRDKSKSNRIWLASGGGGLISFELDSENWTILPETFKQFTQKDGLPNNVIHAIYEDDYRNFWIPSDNGLIRFNLPTEKIKVYTEWDGLPYNEFNKISHYQAADGQLFFGTLNGVTSFYPKQLLDIESKFDVPLRISKYLQHHGVKDTVENKTTAIIQQNQIIFQPKDKFCDLEFALLEYQEAAQIQYSYRILGQNENWKNLKDNSLRINNLEYGTYQLEIRAQGVSGQISKSQLKIPISVLKPFYLKWWFFIAAALGLASLMWIFLQIRTRNLKEQRKILQKLVKERTQIIEAQSEELRSLDKMKSQFFANISHELRTPLTLILAPIQNILKRNKLINQDHTQLLLAQKNTKQLGKLVNQILDLSKLESGKLQLNSDTVAWYVFLRTIVANFESVANSRDINFQFQYEGDEYLQVSIDKEKVETILVNLLSNAFKFTSRAGTVTLAAENKATNLQIIVEDSGEGIPAEDLPHVFDRYFQTKSKNATARGGTGIGLAICQEFSRLMNGNLFVESELSKGTKFTLTIPRKEIIGQIATHQVLQVENALTNAEKIIPQPEVQNPTNTDTNRPTILLVEDNYDLRHFIQSLLSEKYNVITAENGKVALERLTLDAGRLTADDRRLTQKAVPSIVNRQSSIVSRPPSLILSDLMMPIMDGYQLLEQVKSNPQFQNIPVIMLTARAATDDRLKALRIGVDDYLTKPFNQDELMVRIENLLKNAAVRAENKLVETKPVIEKTEIENPQKPALDETAQAWLDELEANVERNLKNFNYNSEQMAADMAISKRQLLRKMKSLIGLPPSQYLKTFRLNKARQLLSEENTPSVKATAYSVGYKDVAHFSKLFKEEFGKLPSEF